MYLARHECNREETCANCEITREDCVDSKMLGHPDRSKTPGQVDQGLGSGSGPHERLGHSKYPSAASFFDSLPRPCTCTCHLTGIFCMAQSCPRDPIMPGRPQRLWGMMYFTPLAVDVDLRPIHIPRLQSLALRQFTFSHDSKFDWVVSHQSNLQKLYLDNCSILHRIGFAVSEYLDEEGYLRRDLLYAGANTVHFGWSAHLEDERAAVVTAAIRFAKFITRWYAVFHQFSKVLGKLRIFKFGRLR